MTLKPLFEATTFEDLCSQLAIEFELTVDDIENHLRQLESADETMRAFYGDQVKQELEGIIGKFGLAIGLASAMEEVAENGWDQPWMYLWNFVVLIPPIGAEDIRLKHNVDPLKRLMLAFKADQPPPENLLPDGA